MSGEKKCRKCGRTTTSSDGVCGNRSRAECERLSAGGDSGDAVLEHTSLQKSPSNPPPKKKSDALKRMRLVAEAFGYDADELLATYAEGWLAAVRENIEKLEAGGE